MPSAQAADVKHLSTLVRLDSLSLRRVGLVEVGWVCGMTRLRSLDLGGNGALASLQGLPSGIQALSLQGCVEIPDSAVAALGSTLGGLRSLELAGCTLVGDGAVGALAKSCIPLEQLGLQGTSLTGVGFRALRQLTALRALDVRQTRVEWDDLTALQGLGIQMRHDPNPAHAVEEQEGDGDGNDDE